MHYRSHILSIAIHCKKKPSDYTGGTHLEETLGAIYDINDMLIPIKELLCSAWDHKYDSKTLAMSFTK